MYSRLTLIDFALLALRNYGSEKMSREIARTDDEVLADLSDVKVGRFRLYCIFLAG